MRGIVITHECSLAGQLKPFHDALSHQLAQSGHSMISKCIINKKALEDNDELFVTEPPDLKKWTKKVKTMYKGTDRN